MSYTFTDAILGLGARLYDSTDGVSWSEVVSLSDLGPPSDPDVDQIEIAPVSPNNGNSVEYLNGLVKNGDFEFTQYWNKTRYAHHLSLKGTRVYYKVVMPEGSYSIIVGNLKKAKKGKSTPKEPETIECKVQVCAAEVFTAAS